MLEQAAAAYQESIQPGGEVMLKQLAITEQATAKRLCLACTQYHKILDLAREQAPIPGVSGIERELREGLVG